MAKKRSSGKKKSKPSQSELPSDRFINRELGWLAFNERVLDQAADESLPLLERAKFLAITSSNLDEFVMVRVGGLQIHTNSLARDPTGLTVSEQLHAVLSKCQVLVDGQYRLLRESLEPKLAAAEICRIDLNECSDPQLRAAEERFREEVMAVLSPQALALRPFPLLQGLGMYLCVRLRREDRPHSDGGDDQADPPSEWEFAVVPLGKTVSRIISLPCDRGHAYVLLEDLVKHFVAEFFPGREVIECEAFRVTRNADVAVREDEAGDLLSGMEEVLESRRLSRAVRLEYGASASDLMVAFLSESLQTTQQILFAIDGPLDLTYLFALHGLEGCDASAINRGRRSRFPRLIRPKRCSRPSPPVTFCWFIRTNDLIPWSGFWKKLRLIRTCWRSSRCCIAPAATARSSPRSAVPPSKGSTSQRSSN